MPAIYPASTYTISSIANSTEASGYLKSPIENVTSSITTMN